MTRIYSFVASSDCLVKKIMGEWVTSYWLLAFLLLISWIAPGNIHCLLMVKEEAGQTSAPLPNTTSRCHFALSLLLPITTGHILP
jgi:hypothetical protein